MEIQISEILDRLSILLIKVEEIGQPADKEFIAYASELLLKSNVDFNVAIPAIRKLYEINKKLWDVEYETSNAKNISDKQMSKAAKDVRIYNNQRVKFRNEVAKKLGGFVDIKKGYYDFDKK